MDFKLSEEQEMLRASAREFLEKECPSHLVRELEEDGLVNRKMYPEIPPKVEYSLTEFGRTVAPILEALCEWGSEYLGRQCILGQDE